MNGHLGKQHSSVTLERRCQSALRAHVRIVGAGFKPAPTAAMPMAISQPELLASDRS